jgi:hypothetical protein
LWTHLVLLLCNFKVLYDDGEQEILDLGVERWQLTTKKQRFVKVGSSCPMDGFVPFPILWPSLDLMYLSLIFSHSSNMSLAIAPCFQCPAGLVIIKLPLSKENERLEDTTDS